MDILSVVCQAVSVYVVSACMVVKVPQIWNIVKANNTDGLNLKSILMELWW